MNNFSLALERYKNNNIERVYNVSLELFANKGIQRVSLNEIATKSEIGIASLYRYFTNKKTLVCECALYHMQKIVDQVTPKINSIQFLNRTAIKEFEELLSCYISLYKDNNTFLKFLSEFDSYISFNKMNKDIEFAYNQLFESFYTIAQKLYKKGLEDGSIRDDFDFESFYFSVSSSLFTTCIKGALSPSLIPLDSVISVENKLKTQIQIAIYYCKKERICHQ